jgi:thiol-disulfide isomerase/thioredoxin
MSRVQRRQTALPADRRKLILYSSLGLVAIIAVIAVAFASRVPKTASDAPAFAALSKGQPAPAFTVSTTAGPFDSTKTGGKPILLEVFATWCPHCQHETTVLDPLYQKFGKQIDFVAVSGSAMGMDSVTTESQADVVSFAQKFDVHYPVAFDESLDVAKKYLQGGYPTIVVIDKQNKIASVDDGEIDPATLTQRIKAVL